MNTGDVEYYKVPAQSGRAFRLPAGSFLRLIDVEGAQIADVFAFSETDPSEWLSTGQTRTMLLRLFPQIGQCFYSNSKRPMLTLCEDESPGSHDMLFPPCDPRMYEQLGVKGHHPSCAENFKRAVVDAGYANTYMPDPVNIFQNTPVNDSGEFLIGGATSMPGDFVTFRAEMDLLFVVTACSQDVWPSADVNGARCTDIGIEISTIGPVVAPPPVTYWWSADG